MTTRWLARAALLGLVTAAPTLLMAQKPRARDLGIPLDGTPGPNNAITDVAGVEVGYTTLISGDGRRVIGKGPVRTGVTAILPRGKATLEPVFAAFYAANGNGDMTGTHWVEESGVLETPIMITNTLSVGTVRDAVVDWMVKRNAPGPFWYPVVAETADGRLNDMKGLHVKAEHAIQALESATSGKIAEGNVGGGTGMSCHQFKGGTGTSSRLVTTAQGNYTVGVLVQCNYGLKNQLRVAGVPVGREIQGYSPCLAQRVDPPVKLADGSEPPLCAPTASGGPREGFEELEQGSIIIVVATDAPLSPDQLKRIVRRVTLGMGRMGANNGNGSGDIFIAFSTANRGADWGNSASAAATPPTIARLQSGAIDPLFTATVEATEEAILNALVAADTMTGADYWRAYALPHAELVASLERHGLIRR